MGSWSGCSDELERVGELQRPPAIVLAPRPDVDVSDLVPDPTHELRWPLSMASHPELEPQFEIAAALAEPGVGWMDLCRLGAHNRHLGKDKRDHVQYLRGWCSVGKQDHDAALAHLVPLTSSVVLGLASGDANDATRLLAKNRSWLTRSTLRRRLGGGRSTIRLVSRRQRFAWLRRSSVAIASSLIS